MDTHEHLIPDEDLPGHGVLDADFARNMLREQEEQGILIWCEDGDHYRPSARAMMVTVGMAIVAGAQELDPEASKEETTRAILACIPWVDAEEAEFDPFVPGEPPEDMEIPDTFPEDWADAA